MASRLSKPGAGGHSSRFFSTFNLPLVSIIWTSCFLISAIDLPARISANDLSTDVSALLAFKGNLTQINYWLRSTWNDPATVCSSWEGVACNGVPPRVVNLSLPGKALTGAIYPSTIGNLDALQVLRLTQNRLNGPIPPDLANCKSLLILALARNRFSGPLSSSFDFSAWPQLRLLNLSLNELDGSIPASITGLRSIRTIALRNNSLSGRIPSFAATGSVPWIFNVANNPELEGPIPESLWNQSPSYFSGNPNLCGPPLAVPCPGDPSPSPSPSPSSSSSPSGGVDDKLKLDEGVIAGISIAGVLVLLLICSLLLCRRKARWTPNAPEAEMVAPTPATTTATATATATALAPIPETGAVSMSMARA